MATKSHECGTCRHAHRCNCCGTSGWECRVFPPRNYDYPHVYESTPACGQYVQIEKGKSA